MAKHQNTLRRSAERALKELRLNIGSGSIGRTERLAYFRELKLHFEIAQVKAVEGLDRGDFKTLEAALKAQRDILAAQRVLTEHTTRAKTAKATTQPARSTGKARRKQSR
jgi:hypothetical protein